MQCCLRNKLSLFLVQGNATYSVVAKRCLAYANADIFQSDCCRNFGALVEMQYWKCIEKDSVEPHSFNLAACGLCVQLFVVVLCNNNGTPFLEASMVFKSRSSISVLRVCFV